MTPDRVAILDWSANGRPKLGADSIWLGVSDRAGLRVQNLPTRAEAEAALGALIRDSIATGQTLLLGVDFSLGYPQGFAETLTGQADPRAVWRWLSDHIRDAPDNTHNLRTVAARANAHFAGDGPFWGNGAKQDVPGLPRRKPALPPGLAEFRATEIAARAMGAQPKSCWQLAGAGAVGAQSLLGLPLLHRLRLRHPISTWPFDPPTAPVVLAEVYPSLITPAVSAFQTSYPAVVRDAVQVGLLARALSNLGNLTPLRAIDHPDAPTEGWILGLGHEARLTAALTPTDEIDLRRALLGL